MGRIGRPGGSDVFVLFFLEELGSLPNFGIDCNNKRKTMLESATQPQRVSL